MKFAFDFHGVIDKHPKFFKEIMYNLISDNFLFSNMFGNLNDKKYNNSTNEVWIISGPPIEELKRELLEYDIKQNIHYTHIDSIISYLLRTLNKHKNKIWKDDNGWWVDNEILWNTAKSMLCNMHNIDFIIDNTKKYAKYFDVPGILTEFIYFGE